MRSELTAQLETATAAAAVAEVNFEQQGAELEDARAEMCRLEEEIVGLKASLGESGGVTGRLCQEPMGHTLSSLGGYLRERLPRVGARPCNSRFSSNSPRPFESLHSPWTTPLPMSPEEVQACADTATVHIHFLEEKGEADAAAAAEAAEAASRQLLETRRVS